MAELHPGAGDGPAANTRERRVHRRVSGRLNYVFCGFLGIGHQAPVLDVVAEGWNAERRRKRDAILQILFEEAAQGRCYTANQFAEGFEGQAGLGGERTIRERIGALATQGYVKFFRNAELYGLPSCGRTKFGYLCVEDMGKRPANPS